MAKTKPHHMFKITREIKIALTTIAAGILLFVGINFLKGINIFESSNSYYVKFKDIKGLAVSNAVYANGYDAIFVVKNFYHGVGVFAHFFYLFKLRVAS